jgi:hypothetical protein
MKFDTKKCTPIKGSPEEAMVHPNRYILQKDEEDDKTGASATGTPGGREKKYMANLIYSEVLTSTRESEKKNGPRRLLTTADVDDLSQHLESLFVSCGDGNDGDSKKMVVSDLKVIKTKIKVEGGGGGAEFVTVGRLPYGFYSPKSHKVKAEEGKEGAENVVLLGRVADEFYSPKSRTSMGVLRSARKVNK